MNETMSDISECDRQKIKELRAAVANEITPYYDTDYNLLRWLKGHNSNIEEILPKLRNHLILRKSHFDLDNVAVKPRDHPIHKYWQGGLTGCAGPKNPDELVNIEQTGTNDFWGILQTYPLNEIMKARIYDLENMLKAVMDHEKKNGKQASILYIMDLTGLKYHSNLITLLRGPLASISAFMSEHYVELIHSFVLVGVPSFISAIWTIAKPLLPERTKQKVKILGHDWQKEILELAVPESLPAFWNIEKQNQLFSAEIIQSVLVDPQVYYKKESELHNAKLFTVGAGKTGCIEIEAKEGQKLSWKFDVDGNLSYGLYFANDPKETTPSKMVSVYPTFNKVPGPTFVPIADSIVCKRTGIYKLWYSNVHAWFHTLNIRYEIIVS